MPCYLCLIERWPYFCLLLFSAAGIFYKNTFVAFAISLVMFASLVISGYHVGIEHKWWEESIYCKKSLIKFPENNIIDNLDNLPILNQSCNETSFKIMNISMVEINFLFSVALFAMSIIYQVNRRRKSY